MALSVRARGGEWFDRLLIGSLTASVGILMVGLFSWQVPFGSQVQLGEGQVAPYDIVAPRQITYESQILTDRARERAAQNVPDQYDTPDGRVRRQQVDRSQDVMEYISMVRADEYASESLKIDYLLSVPDIVLTPELAAQMLSLSSQEWQRIVEEVPSTLERLMREEIRESNLATYQRRVSAQIASDLSESASLVVVELVRSLLRPNSTLNLCKALPWSATRSSCAPAMSPPVRMSRRLPRSGCCKMNGIGGRPSAR